MTIYTLDDILALKDWDKNISKKNCLNVMMSFFAANVFVNFKQKRL